MKPFDPEAALRGNPVRLRVERGCDVEFLREVIINENGVFIEVEQ